MAVLPIPTIFWVVIGGGKMNWRTRPDRLLGNRIWIWLSVRCYWLLCIPKVWRQWESMSRRRSPTLAVHLLELHCDRWNFAHALCYQTFPDLYGMLPIDLYALSKYFQTWSERREICRSQRLDLKYHQGTPDLVALETVDLLGDKIRHKTYSGQD